MRIGFWIWQIKECERGDPLLIAGEAFNAGITDVFIKVADGVNRYNITNGKDMVPATVDALRAVGTEVWGWQYIYGENPKKEAEVALQRIRQLVLKKFVVNAEIEFKASGMAAKAEEYLKILRAGFDGELAFTSYRFPHYHLEFPWDVFYKYCDTNMPQVYWEQAHNPGHQLNVSLDRFIAMNPQKPILPIGAAYKWNGWRPTLSEVQEFIAAAKARNLPMISFWSWQHCRRDLPELWPKREKQENDELERIEQQVATIEKTLVEVATTIEQIKNAIQILGAKSS